MILFKMWMAAQATALFVILYGALMSANEYDRKFGTADKIAIGLVASLSLSLTAVLFIL